MMRPTSRGSKTGCDSERLRELTLTLTLTLILTLTLTLTLIN